MTISEATLGGAIIVSAQGRIDMSNSEDFKDALMAALAGAGAAVIVDVAGVDYISSAGLRSLMIALRSAKAEGKAFGVAALSPLVLEIFTISRFNLVFALYAGVRDAVAALSPDSLGQFDAS